MRPVHSGCRFTLGRPCSTGRFVPALTALVTQKWGNNLAGKERIGRRETGVTEGGLQNSKSMAHRALRIVLAQTRSDIRCNSVAFANLVAAIEQRLRSGESVAVHCRAGIGRSGL